MSVDFNTADPLIRWDSYENLSADGEGASGVLGQPRVRSQMSCRLLGGCNPFGGAAPTPCGFGDVMSPVLGSWGQALAGLDWAGLGGAFIAREPPHPVSRVCPALGPVPCPLSLLW